MKELKSAASAPSLIGLVTSFLLSLSALTASAAERAALLVGVGEYPEAGLFDDLKTPINDVKLIAKSLREVGFEVILAENPTSTEMKTKVADFCEKITPGGTAFFYFAGHAVQIDGENYLMGSSAEFLKKYQLGEESINAKLVLDAIGAKKPKSTFVFLDCCRSRPPKSWLNTGSIRPQPRGLAPMDSPRDIMISYSAAPGEPAVDREGDHSPYAESLAKQLLSGLEVYPMLRTVTREVLKATESVQRPWYNGSFIHEFYFSQKVSEKEQTYAPVLPMILPSSGYFSNSEVFVGSAYTDYSEYAKKGILKKAQGNLEGAGAPDGKMGKNTQNSIIAYQTANSLPVTGRMDQATLTKLRMTGIPNATYPKKSYSRSSRSSYKKRPSGSSNRFPPIMRTDILSPRYR